MCLSPLVAPGFPPLSRRWVSSWQQTHPYHVPTASAMANERLPSGKRLQRAIWKDPPLLLGISTVTGPYCIAMFKWPEGTTDWKFLWYLFNTWRTSTNYKSSLVQLLECFRSINCVNMSGGSNETSPGPCLPSGTEEERFLLRGIPWYLTSTKELQQQNHNHEVNFHKINNCNHCQWLKEKTWEMMKTPKTQLFSSVVGTQWNSMDPTLWRRLRPLPSSARYGQPKPWRPADWPQPWREKIRRMSLMFTMVYSGW